MENPRAGSRSKAATQSGNLLFALCLGVAVLAAGCSNQVAIPPGSQDQAPVITVSGFPIGGSGTIETQNVTTTSTVNVDTGTNLGFSGSAKNPGGVKTFSMTITQGQAPLYQVATSSAPDQNGLVPTLLSIPGTNGAGGPGSNAMNVSMLSPVSVAANANNFNNQTAAINVTYVPVSPSLRNNPNIPLGTITMTRSFGQTYWTGTFPTTTPVPDGFVSAIVDPFTTPVLLLKAGHTAADCSDTTATVEIFPGENIASTQIFGTPQAQLPVTLTACPFGSGPQTNTFTIQAAYQLR